MDLLEVIQKKQDAIYEWLQQHEHEVELPIYSSVDVRDSGFKTAVVDTNLFPAGFNNLCEHGLADAVPLIRRALEKRVPGCRSILIISEEHTRNTWYLENIHILTQLIQDAGFKVKVASFLYEQPRFCEEGPFIELVSATGKTVRIHCVKHVMMEIEKGASRPDLIILNNDLTSGIPDVLKHQKIPIYPALQAGWHARSKTHHFQLTHELMREFGERVGLDPWFFSCLDASVEGVNINEEQDRLRLKEAADALFDRITAKYREHGIDEKPFIFLKADSGTYGMGVMAFESPEAILQMNRRDKNKLYRGKSSKVITRFLLQEGVPGEGNHENQANEVCVYQVDNQLIGGFYRLNSEKGTRENLNAKGMSFKTLCPHNRRYGDCHVHSGTNRFDIYRILARIAGIAAHREMNPAGPAAVVS